MKRKVEEEEEEEYKMRNHKNRKRFEITFIVFHE